ncbi:MAG: hypothetical protein EA391_00250 [Balneolaceae bacterium]|nr:MAG: hypothetical protein EA391_00250 [Balneolaceae bacterium]
MNNYRILLILATLFYAIACSNSNEKSFFDGGNGTEANPYQISTIEQLQEIKEKEYLDKHFIQVADIDASPSAELQNGSGFRYIGTREAPFTGSYNGNGYSINDLHIHFSRFLIHSGLFGYIKNATLENIYVDNRNQIPDKQKWQNHALNINQNQKGKELSFFIDVYEMNGAGGLVGFNEGGTIRNCRFNGFVGTQFQPVGGLVGINTGAIENSRFQGSSVNIGIAAGLVAINSGQILNSTSAGTVSGQASAGLVGRNMEGEIIESSTTAIIFSGRLNGGIATFNSGVIRSSFSRDNRISNVRGSIGGLVAYNDGEIINSYSITEFNSYFDPDVDFFFGGIVGENLENGSIQTSFAAGYILPLEQSILGGLAGKNSGGLMNVYWDTDSTAQAKAVDQGNPEGATGLTTVQMTGPAAEQNMPGFDWVNVWRTTPDGYPVLRWEDE